MRRKVSKGAPLAVFCLPLFNDARMSLPVTAHHNSRHALIYLGLGANLGEPEASLCAAAATIATWPEVSQARLSSRYRSAPIDSSGDDYVNAVLEIQTSIPALSLLDRLQALELQHGRERPYQNAPRTLDLDILLYQQQELKTPRLTLPHPRLHLRAFVLLPLLELAPDLNLPGLAAAQHYLASVAGQAISLLPGSQIIDYFKPISS